MRGALLTSKSAIDSQSRSNREALFSSAVLDEKTDLKGKSAYILFHMSLLAAL